MKTFLEFSSIPAVNLILEAGDRPRRNPGESVQDYYKRTRGTDVSNHPDLTPDPRVSGKTTNVSSSSAGFGGGKKQTTQTAANPSAKTSAASGTGSSGPSKAQNFTSKVKNSAKQAASKAANTSAKDVVDAGKQAVSSAKTSAKQTAQSVRQAAQDATQNLKNTAQKVKDTARQAASKAYRATPKSAAKAAQQAVSDVSTKMKYGKTIRPDTTGTSALVKSTGAAAKASKGLKVPGLKTGSALSGVIGAADEKSKGSGWARSLAKGATVAAGTALGGLVGGAAGSVAGPVGTAVGGYTGQAAGAAAADKAFDTVAGANAVQRKAMATSNRQRQAGGGLAGIGGKTTFSKGKNGTGFMSTGSGSQRKTVQLAKTSVVKDPKTGKAEVGNLAFKGGKAVYKRSADPSTLAQTSSNPLERVGRSLFAGAYKKSDEQARQAKLKTAAASDVARQKALGVKGSKNLVGPKIVGTGSKNK